MPQTLTLNRVSLGERHTTTHTFTETDLSILLHVADHFAAKEPENPNAQVFFNLLVRTMEEG